MSRKTADRGLFTGTRTAIYCRLSKDDELQGESASIQHQRDMLANYCEEQGWQIVGIYADDGFTGLNQNRPDFQRMIKDCDAGLIDIVITKDLSRLGRNYLETGWLQEQYFPKKGIRYIALNDGYDTTRTEGNELTPFKNMMNEFYSRDVSKKVHSSYVLQAKKGKFTGCLAPFGYMKDPNDKNALIVDEDTAWIVKKIFAYALSGLGTNAIRRKLEAEKIPTPTWWNRRKGLRNRQGKFELENEETGKYVWDFKSLQGILTNPVYIGNIASQKAYYRFKTGWIKDKQPEDWIVVENVHEPIIDADTFYLVQEKIRERKRPDAWGNFSLFAGLVKCGECGSTMTSRTGSDKNRSRIMTCSRYTKYGVNHCTQHRIDYNMLYQIVLEQIRTYARLALEDEDGIVQELRKARKRESEEDQKRISNVLYEHEKRLKELDNIVSSLYEDKITGRISEANFTKLMQRTQEEQETLQRKVDNLKQKTSDEIKTNSDNSKWLALIRKYADIQELDRELLNRLIKTIVVHEELSGRERRIEIEIHFNFKTEKGLLEAKAGYSSVTLKTY